MDGQTTRPNGLKFGGCPPTGEFDSIDLSVISGDVPLQVFCLVVAGGLTQDLTLILSTKNTEQNKT